MISAIRHLKDPVNLEDMFELYMKTRDMNVEFVTNYLRDNSPLSEFVGGMTDELGGSHITEYVSNGPTNYAIRTADGKQIVKSMGSH